MASLSEEPFTINFRDRIAQIVFAKVEKAEFEEVESLSQSIRGVKAALEARINN